MYGNSGETLLENQRGSEFEDFVVEALVRMCILEEVLKEVRDEPWTGMHFGLTKTLEKLQERYTVKNTEKEVEKYMLKRHEGRAVPERCRLRHCGPVGGDIFQPLKPSGCPKRCFAFD
ncbi:hypothetical protein EVAR_10215_1 [Eumeta japonica]|uniref:Integrase zinc-binding domain-containing protein n=1 Tax=Eumeta variegata TaxID=151549 RepID=A0A4C1TEH3_EUMVA|nr:hypothetical protein EVAR_10215_1 [Eumeta japonica]